MYKTLCVVIIILTIPATAQDIKHAPSQESCLADLRLWTSEIPGWPDAPNRAALQKLTIREMKGRMQFIRDCGGAYPIFFTSQRGELPATIGLVLAYVTEIKDRLFSFTDRHGLSGKFLEEDEAGKR